MSRSNYKAWEITTDEFPVLGDDLSITKFFLRYGILAPSVHNTQPWLFDVNALSIKISPDYSKSLPEADPGNHFMFMSIGACAETMKVAATYFGYTTKYLFGSGNSLTVVFKKGAKQNASIHPDVITRRFSNKFMYKKKKVRKEIIERVLLNVKEKNASLSFVQSDVVKKQLIKEHIKALKRVMKNKFFVRELIEKLIPNYSRSETGMPGTVIGLKSLQSIIFPKIIHIFPSILAKGAAYKDMPLVENTAGFGIIYSQTNSYNSMIEIGGVYQKMSLLLRSENIHNSMLTAVVLQERERQKVEKICNLNGKVRLFFRFGYPEQNKRTAHTPRKNAWG